MQELKGSKFLSFHLLAPASSWLTPFPDKFSPQGGKVSAEAPASHAQLQN